MRHADAFAHSSHDRYCFYDLATVAGFFTFCYYPRVAFTSFIYLVTVGPCPTLMLLPVSGLDSAYLECLQ